MVVCTALADVTHLILIPKCQIDGDLLHGLGVDGIGLAVAKIILINKKLIVLVINAGIEGSSAASAVLDAVKLGEVPLLDGHLERRKLKIVRHHGIDLAIAVLTSQVVPVVVGLVVVKLVICQVVVIDLVKLDLLGQIAGNKLKLVVARDTKIIVKPRGVTSLGDVIVVHLDIRIRLKDLLHLLDGRIQGIALLILGHA